MRNSLLYILLLLTFFQFSCNNADDGVDYMDFLGTESYFRNFDDIVPESLADTLGYYSDSVGYDYFKLFEITPFASIVEGEYDINQITFMQHKDPFEEKNITDVDIKIDFYEQRNALLSMKMQIDTMFQTLSPHIMYQIDDITHADSMFIVTDTGDNGYFMMYGNAETEIDRANINVESMTMIENTHIHYNYESVIVVVGKKEDNAIRRIAFFEYIKEGNDLPYQVASIRAFADEDDMSYIHN